MNRRRERSGVAALELAVLLPFLTLVLGIAIDYCRVFQIAQVLNRSIYVAALYTSGQAHHDPVRTAEAVAREVALKEGSALNPPLTDANLTIVTTSAQTQVTVTYNMTPIIHLPGQSSTVRLVRSVTLPCASPP